VSGCGGRSKDDTRHNQTRQTLQGLSGLLVPSSPRPLSLCAPTCVAPHPEPLLLVEDILVKKNLLNIVEGTLLIVYTAVVLGVLILLAQRCA